MIEYRCCFCRKIYDWYDGIYENPKYDSQAERIARHKGEAYTEEPGGFIAVNGFTLCRILPVNDGVSAGCAIEAEPANGNLNVYLNICPDCMRKMLDNLYPEHSDENAWSESG